MSGNPVTFPSARQFTQIALETIQGTPVAGTATLPLEKFDPEDMVTSNEDKSNRGSMVEVYDEILGVGHSECQFSGLVYPDTFGWLLAGILGDVTSSGATVVTTATGTSAQSTITVGSASGIAVGQGVTGTGIGASAKVASIAGLVVTLTVVNSATVSGSATFTPPPYLNTFAVSNGGAAFGQPHSYTFTDWSGAGTNQARQWPGQVFESVNLKWNANGLFTFDAKTLGWLSVPAGAIPTPNPSSVETIAAWKAAPTLGGSAVVNMPDGEISITRKLEVIDTTDGSQNPYFIQGGKVGVTFKFAQVAVDESPLINMLTNVIQAFTVNLADGATPSATSTGIRMQMSKAKYKVTKIDRSKEALGWTVDGVAIANPTDAVGATGGYSPLAAFATSAINGASTY
jgi:hypothetical protein